MLIIADAECMIARRARNVASRTKGIYIKDDTTVLNLVGATDATNRVVKDVCAKFNKLLAQYMDDQYGATSNGEVIWHGNSHVKSDIDHNGDVSQYTRYFDSPWDLVDGVDSEKNG